MILLGTKSHSTDSAKCQIRLIFHNLWPILARYAVDDCIIHEQIIEIQFCLYLNDAHQASG